MIDWTKNQHVGKLRNYGHCAGKSIINEVIASDEVTITIVQRLGGENDI